MEKQETFFQSVFEWSKRHTIFEETTTCTLPQAIPYSLFHDKLLHFVEKIYRRHNNLMTGVLWRALRSIITSRIFLVLQKRYFGSLEKKIINFEEEKRKTEDEEISDKVMTNLYSSISRTLKRKKTYIMLRPLKAIFSRDKETFKIRKVMYFL